MKLTLAILALGLAACVHPWGEQDPPPTPTPQKIHIWAIHACEIYQSAQYGSGLFPTMKECVAQIYKVNWNSIYRGVHPTDPMGERLDPPIPPPDGK